MASHAFHTPAGAPILLDQQRSLASYDAFVDTATRSVVESAAARRPIALLVADVDHYRRIAADHGDDYAQGVLATIFSLARANLREGELLAHPGGDEFVALLRASGPNARGVAERLCAAVRGHAFPDSARGPAPRVTVSIGVASAPEHGATYAALHAAADGARVRLKAQGRDGAALAPPPHQEPAHRPLDIARFAGRTEEMRTLVQMLDDAVAGRPRVVAILGEAGAGTALLVRQIEPEVRLRGGSLVTASARDRRVREPYGVWSTLLRALHRLPGAPTGPWRELHHLLPVLGGEASSGEVRWGSKYRLLDEIADYLRRSATHAPLVLLLDEMQWADTASWDVLEHIVQQLDAERVLFCLTFRSEPAYAAVAERRQALAHGKLYREIVLPRLTREEAKRWLESALHTQEIGREFLAFLYRHTEGNPFFIAQLVRTLVEEGSLWHGNGRWQWTPVSELRLPVGARALVTRRVSWLSASTQAVLSTAAVIGEEFDVSLVVAAGAGSEAAVQLALTEGLAAGILRSTYERGGSSYAFTYGLMREMLIESIPAERLRQQHQRVAEALERRDRTRVLEIALHYDAAAVSAPAYLYALLAVERAERVYAYVAAHDVLEVALRNATTPAELAEVRVRLATVAETMGRFDEAEELCDLAIEWFVGKGDGHRALTLRRMRERARKELGQPARLLLDSLLALDEEAQRIGEARERVEIMMMISQAHGRLGDPREAERIAAECVSAAERIDDPMLLAQALNRHAITVERDSLERAEVIYRRALAIFQRIGDARGQARCHNNLGNIAATRNDWQQARQSYSTAIALAQAAGMPDLWGTAASNLGVSYHRSGEYERARELLGEALALVAAVKNSEIQLYALYNMAHLEFDTRAWESGAELYEATASLAQRIGAEDVEIGATAGVGLCRAEGGDLDAAHRALAWGQERARRRADWFQGRELLEALAVWMLVEDGRFESAADHLDAVLPVAEATDFWSATWLTLVCARRLFPRVPDRMRPWLMRYGSQVSEFGYADITRQLNNLLNG